jgi:hypothetical protein
MGRITSWLSSRYASALFSFGSFQALLLMLTALCSFLFIAESVRFLPVRSDNIYPEAAGVLSAQRWAHGLPLYEDYRQPPYLITPFPPVWYCVLALGAKVGFSDLNSLTLFGRILSLASLFGVVGLGYLWNRRIGLSRPLSLLTPTFYLSLPILIPWAVAARPDFLALLLGFAALSWSGFRTGAKSTSVAALLAAMAFLVRHNAVAVPVAVVLWLVWSRRWRHACVFTAIWALVVGTTVAVFQVYTHGLLLLNLSGATFGQFALTYIRDIAGRLLMPAGHGFVVALFAFGIFGFIETWKQKDARTRLMGIYLLVSCVLAVVGSAARGAAVNHYFEPALAMAVLIPTGVARLATVWKSESPLASFATVFVLVLLLPSLDMQRSYFMHNKPDNLQPLARMMGKRRVFTDIPYLAARTPTLELLEPASLMNTERAGGRVGWSSALIAEALQEKKYELVILSFPVDAAYDPFDTYPRYTHLDSAVRAAIVRDYHLCFQLDTSDIDGRLETRYVYSTVSQDSIGPGGNCPSLEPVSFSENHTETLLLGR